MWLVRVVSRMWVESMVWLVGVVVRRCIDFLILLIPIYTPLVSLLQQQPPTFCSVLKCYIFVIKFL